MPPRRKTSSPNPVPEISATTPDKTDQVVAPDVATNTDKIITPGTTTNNVKDKGSNKGKAKKVADAPRPFDADDDKKLQRALDALRVRPGHKPDLDHGAEPDLAVGPRHKAEGQAWLREETRLLADAQERFFADGRRALVVVLQGMDTAGKDGVIRAVFGPLNAQGVRVHSFKRPTPMELAHDFLWRVHAVTPPLGGIALFNRSHYEDVLVGRVHRLAPPEAIEDRYDRINDFERLLDGHRTHVVKFMLHIDKDEQRERLQARLDDPAKHWKFNPDDLKERARWKDYMAAYAKALSRCSTERAPWYVIPANRKWYRNWAVARILRGIFDGWTLRYPEPDFDPRSIVVE